MAALVDSKSNILKTYMLTRHVNRLKNVRNVKGFKRQITLEHKKH